MESAEKLITLKQLPIIEQALEEISKTIDFEINEAKNLVPIDPAKTTTHLKKVRAGLKKDFEVIEEQRKAVKSEIMKPYLEFENLYKEKIADKYKQADKYFKGKIDELENEVKAEKEEKIKAYFDDLVLSKGISDVLFFEDLEIVVNLSGSLKSYYEQVKEKVESISSDFEAINALNLGENEKFELLIEYKKTFDLSATILKLEQKKQEIEKLKGEPKIKKEVLEAPEDDEVYTMSFTVKGSKKKLKALKQYLIENNLI